MRWDMGNETWKRGGEDMSPGNPKLRLPSPDHKMVVVGRSASELCKQIKDPKQNGGRSLGDLLHHMTDDDLVGWGWNPGDGRAPPPPSTTETTAQMKVWIDGGAACPQ